MARDEAGILALSTTAMDGIADGETSIERGS